MKVKVTENTKSAFLISEIECIKVVENAMKEWGGVTKDDMQILANFVGGSEILKAEAEFAKNRNVWNKYGEGSGRADVWVTLTVFDSWKTFKIVGAYLSDIWEIGGTDSKELEGRMYIRVFEETK